VVRTADSADEVLRSGINFAKSLGKLPVICRVGEGFIGNRIFSRYRQICDEMLEDGALPDQIDAALEEFGFPMGPYAVTDFAGLEISWARRKRQAANRDPAQRYAGTLADRLCEAGRFGRKAGRGYYRYDGDKRQVDPEVAALLAAIATEKGITRRSFDVPQIIERVLAGMVSEGRALLAAGIAQRASDIDLVLIHGYGFPAWRGGPMFMTDRGETQ
jgi:3-hydroxyacyl-CoA dehydrogenase